MNLHIRLWHRAGRGWDLVKYDPIDSKKAHSKENRYHDQDEVWWSGSQSQYVFVHYAPVHLHKIHVEEKGWRDEDNVWRSDSQSQYVIQEDVSVCNLDSSLIIAINENTCHLRF